MSDGIQENVIDLMYAGLLSQLKDTGERITTRNSNVRRKIGTTIVCPKTPLISLRRTAWKNALREMEWFLSGSSDINTLHPAVRSWWEPWADKNTGVVGYNYGHQFRQFCGWGAVVDQIALLLKGLRNHPYSRRNVITTWNTADMNNPFTPITNCHGTVIQCFVTADNRLDMITYQRSVDVVCGLPHNLIQYWAFLMWLAYHSGRTPGQLGWIGGDVHLYEEHIPLADEIIEEARKERITTPNLVYSPASEEFRADDFGLDGEYLPRIMTRAEMIV